MEEDSNMISKVLKGNKEEYGLLVKKYMKKAYFIALGIVKDPDEALDLSQEAFVKAFKNLKNFDVRKPFFPWFYKILKNLCLNFSNKKRRGQKALTEIFKLQSHEKEKDSSIKKSLLQAVEELPFEEKEIIMLRYFQGLSYEEISEILECPIGTVMSRLYYAKKKLKEKMKGF
ncbi:MAG: sigma-70 family RNA polymerase sigma factor [Acidobacteriota bacterium]